MVKYRLAGIAGSSWLLLGSSIGLHSCSQFLPRSKSDHAAGGNGYFLAGFGVAAGAFSFVTQLEIAKTGNLDRHAIFERAADGFKPCVHTLLGFAFVEPNLVKQGRGKVCFCQ